MKIKKISYLGSLEDLVIDCLDVFVTLENESGINEETYLVEVTTPEFLSFVLK